MLKPTCAAAVLVVLLLSSSLHSSDEPYNYAALWRSWGPTGQKAYLDGVVDGTFNTFLEAGQAWLEAGQLFGKPETEKVRRIRDRVFVREQAPQIPAVMTDLYADPTNAYVVLIDMVFIARDKLEGRSIDGRLAEARKRALETHRANQQIKNK